MSSWVHALIGVGTVAILFYLYTVWWYFKGRGRDYLERAVKIFLMVSRDGGRLEITRRGKGVVLMFYRVMGQVNWADIRLRVPLSELSLPHMDEIKEVLAERGFEILEDSSSGTWAAEVRIFVEPIWESGSEARGAMAADVILDALGFGKDERFLYAIRGKKRWGLASRPRPY